MFPDLAVIQGNYLRDILCQPQALEDTLRGLEGLDQLRDLARRVRKGRFERILLTGMGSSFHALHPLNLQLVGHGLTALMVETSELVHYKSRLFDPKTLIIAVSQSGRSAEVIRLLKTNRKRSALLAVTNTPDSPLARQADAAALTRAGHEYSVSCKTYVTALMALKWIGDILCERDLRRTHRELKQAASAVSAYLLGWEGHVQSLSSELKGIGQLFFVGRGASLAAVGTGGLIVKESDHFDAEGMSSAAFRHGPFEMLSGQTFVLVFSGNAKTRSLNRKLLEDIRQHGGRAEWLGKDGSLAAFRVPATASSIQPILEILPVQMITLALAAQLGREPGRFDLTSKVTTAE
jgi:glucosamine--fructose-6-phosphate aminotransferase (isomerizing)